MNENATGKPLQGYTVSFQLYAHSAEEAERARAAIVAFIAQHARQGRAVTAGKGADAVAGWERNPIVRSHIINYFK